MDSEFRQGMENEGSENMRTTPPPKVDFVEGISPSMRGVEAVMREVAQSEVPVLLLAENGAGKQATARHIHDLSRRREQAFRWVSCPSEDAVEFGNIGNREGSLAAGTIYLAELADLTARDQAQLLRMLSHEGLQRTSAQTPVRLIFGSARDLEVELKSGSLREDLYYRISGVCLRIPPLRQRREDIPILMEHFLGKFGRDLQRKVPALSKETHRLFQEYSWPGNVRELENAARAIVALGDEAVAMGGLRAMLRRNAEVNGGPVSLKQAARAASRELEKELILRALTRTRWNRRRAAQDLQISYKALLYKLKQMGCSEYRAS